jgi:tetratricopeptide (TPR) repeat protein
MLLSYIVALFSRENALILPALLLLYHYVFKKKLNIYGFLSLLGTALIYIGLRGVFLGSTLPHLSTRTSLLQRLPGFFVAISNYARLLLLPLDQHMEYGNKFFSIAEPAAIAGMVILFLLLACAFMRRKKDMYVSFSIYWFFIALLPLSNLYPIPIAYMAEHWLYVPSIGFFLALSWGLSRIYENTRTKIVAVTIFSVILALYSCLTIRYNRYWNEPMKFYMRNLEYVPDSARTHSCVAIEYYNMGKKEEAIGYLKKAIRINPNDAKAYNNLGRIYRETGNYTEAVSSYKKAIDLNPEIIVAYSNLAVAYIGMGDKDKGREWFENAVKADPGFAGGYYNLAVFHYKEKEFDAALRYCNEAARRGYKIDPDFLRRIRSHINRKQ